jgi:drug/metabolite transporter superfamily protein YnfA
MGKIVSIAFGVLLFAIGGVWALQGLGYLKGSSMTGSSMWAIIGPIVAAFGVSLIYVAVRGPQKKR